MGAQAVAGRGSPAVPEVNHAALCPHFLHRGLVAAVFGFSGIAAGAAGIAKILFILFLIGAAVAFVLGLVNRSPKV